MAILKAFKGIRPVKDKANVIASRPYDVVTAKKLAKKLKEIRFRSTM
jgi:uncharacterized protein (DUF1015 family)